MALDPTGAIIALIAGMLLVFSIIMLGLYIFLSFAYMAIGRKAGLKTPELAWIPGVGPLILAFQASKMHWWPWLLIIGTFIPVVNGLFSLAFMVFAIIWHWKLFEAISKPGWWAIIMLIPIVGLIFIAIAAWGKK